MEFVTRIKNKIFKNTLCEVIQRENQQLFYRIKANQLTNSCLNSSESGVSSSKVADKDVIVSLTTYGKRLHQVYLAIESIMQGTLKPNRIVLWLDEKGKEETLPITILHQMNRGLEVRYTKDIRSYTKLLPMLQDSRDGIIITIDDDAIYAVDLVECLVNAYNKDHNHIHAVRLHKMICNNGELDSYMNWDWNWNAPEGESSSLFFATGVGGVLYPPNCFPHEVFNESVFMDICKYADDVWFYAMTHMNGYDVAKVYVHDPVIDGYMMNEDVQDMSLQNTNIKGQKCLNDVQLQAVFEKYDIYKRIATK